MSQHSFSETIPSETSQGQAIQERIVAVLEELGYPHADVFGMRLALEEAIVNAIKHGNRLDPTKSVHIECDVRQDRVRVVVEDEGSGFDPNKLPDPTSEENLDLPCGRGVLLMRHFLTELSYNDRGNRVTLEKERTSEASDASSQ